MDENAGILAGHDRLLTARKLGLVEVPVIRFDHLSEAQKRAYLIADNQLAVQAGWDDALLAEELAWLRNERFDLDLVGFDSTELERLPAIADGEAASDEGEDEVPQPPEEPVSRPELHTLQKAQVIHSGHMALRVGRSECRSSWSLDRGRPMTGRGPASGPPMDSGEALWALRGLIMTQALARALQASLDRAVAGDPAVHGGVMLVEAPGFKWKRASGAADHVNGIAMLSDDQFQAASITKIVTATTLMTLVEEGQIDLDEGIGRYLPDSLTSGLHDYRGRSYGPAITARQLLSHTSGVADFFGDGQPGPGGILPFVAKMLEDPDKLWEPLEILAWTRANLHPHFPPGQGWHYADTGYVLAGLIIEALSREPLHQAMRRRVLKPLGMRHTYMLYRESARPSLAARSPSRAYVGDLPYGDRRSVTADWAGGGLVTTTEDLARFIRAFAQDRIFESKRSRQQMLTWTPTGEEGVYYGVGVRRFVLEELGMRGFGEVWGHTGFLKSFMLYWPQRDAAICGTLNQSAARGVFSTLRPVSAVVPAVIGELRKHSAEGPGGRRTRMN